MWLDTKLCYRLDLNLRYKWHYCNMCVESVTLLVSLRMLNVKVIIVRIGRTQKLYVQYALIYLSNVTCLLLLSLNPSLNMSTVWKDNKMVFNGFTYTVYINKHIYNNRRAKLYLWVALIYALWVTYTFCCIHLCLIIQKWYEPIFFISGSVVYF